VPPISPLLRQHVRLSNEPQGARIHSRRDGCELKENSHIDNKTASQAAVESIILDPKYHDLLAIVKGARNGAVYGAKVRFPHALVYDFLFLPPLRFLRLSMFILDQIGLTGFPHRMIMLFRSGTSVEPSSLCREKPFNPAPRFQQLTTLPGYARSSGSSSTPPRRMRGTWPSSRPFTS